MSPESNAKHYYRWVPAGLDMDSPAHLKPGQGNFNSRNGKRHTQPRNLLHPLLSRSPACGSTPMGSVTKALTGKALSNLSECLEKVEVLNESKICALDQQ
eukprot:3777442-Amphidinium_carterae.1